MTRFWNCSRYNLPAFRVCILPFFFSARTVYSPPHTRFVFLPVYWQPSEGGPSTKVEWCSTAVFPPPFLPVFRRKVVLLIWSPTTSIVSLPFHPLPVLPLPARANRHSSFPSLEQKFFQSPYLSLSFYRDFPPPRLHRNKPALASPAIPSLPRVKKNLSHVIRAFSTVTRSLDKAFPFTN